MPGSLSTQLNAVVPETMSHGFTYLENAAKRLPTAVLPNEASTPRRPVGSSTPASPDPTLAAPPAGWLRRMAGLLLRNFKAAWRAHRYLKNPTQPTQDRISAPAMTALETLAVDLGAVAIGYARVTPDLVFTGMAAPHDHAIVILSEMRRDETDKRHTPNSSLRSS